ncbi:MAG TPA: MBL fold metallo-hydrolase [Ignavibacteriaceae bacterium]|nr:MBL fold metallo-hydrolase [Ignavibacteriaceae bacterium]
MKRRKFLINGAKYSMGALMLSPFLKEGELKAATARFKPQPAEWREDEINIAWIGHSTVLINFYGKVILTDPVMFSRVGVYLLGITIGPSRITKPALAFDEMPKPDLILLSHAHMDHMDYPSLDSFSSKYPDEIDCLTAYNTKDVIRHFDWKSLQELDWGEETEIQGIKIKAIEVKHFGWRFPWERDRSKGYMKNGRSFNAYVLEYKGTKILFGGDTAMTDHFKQSGESVDIAIMPIGAYQPWRRNHCNPEEALQMAKDLNAKVFIPIHTKTFRQGMEPDDEPLTWLRESVNAYDIKLGISDIGETFTSVSI